MTTTFFVLWIAILAWSGLLIAALDWAATNGPYAQRRIRPPSNGHTSKLQKLLNTGLNNVLALLLFITFLIYRGDQSLYSGWPGLAHFLGETFGVLLLYDFAYYFYHRAMHHPKIMKYMHGVHHKIRYPTASESIFLHPLEQIGAIALLFTSITVLGPISELSFLAMFFIYSSVNIIVHASFRVSHPAFKLFNFWAEKHATHHAEFKHNYAAIFPFWDQAFGTDK